MGDSEEQSVEELIGNLAHEDFHVREAATVELRRRGLRVIPALETALENSRDTEQRGRLQQLIEVIGVCT